VGRGRIKGRRGGAQARRPRRNGDRAEAGELTGDDVRSILAHYSVGELVDLVRLPFDSYNAPSYRVETTTGWYFLKRFKSFTANVDRGLDLVAFLRRQGYPAIEVLLNRDGSPHVTHNDAEVALFEYIELPGADWALPPTRARALGEGLGALHVLARETFFCQ